MQLRGTWEQIPISWDRDRVWDSYRVAPAHRRGRRLGFRAVVLVAFLFLAVLTVLAVVGASRADAIELWTTRLDDRSWFLKLAAERADRSRWIDRSDHGPADGRPQPAVPSAAADAVHIAPRALPAAAHDSSSLSSLSFDTNDWPTFRPAPRVGSVVPRAQAGLTYPGGCCAADAAAGRHQAPRDPAGRRIPMSGRPASVRVGSAVPGAADRAACAQFAAPFERGGARMNTWVSPVIHVVVLPGAAASNHRRPRQHCQRGHDDTTQG